MGTTRRKAGLLGPQVEGYRAWLARRGYTPQTVRNMLKDLGQVGRVAVGRGLEVSELDEERMAAFLADRRAAGHRQRPGSARDGAVVDATCGRSASAPPAQPSVTPLDVLLGQYRSWMVRERGLAAATVLRYENTARRFLQRAGRAPMACSTPAVLTGADVNAFLLRECGRVSAGSAKGRVAELRSILRFLYLQGITPLRLGTAVPPVGGWRLATLPPPAMTRRPTSSVLLDSCRPQQRRRRPGLRDHDAGRAAGPAVDRGRPAASCDDVDWRAGELVVRGKGRRQDRLPLPAEVGEALVAYLSGGRNPQGARHLFLTCRAPRGPIRADLVGDVVERACLRAGLPPVGPHRLRHALAGELLRQGAGLVAISQVLRHQDLATTALYAKVDLDALRQVAQPWPGAAR